MSTAGEDPLERRRDELLAIVYGPAGEPGDEVVAELAALERELAARRREDGRVAAPASTEPAGSPDRGTTDDRGTIDDSGTIDDAGTTDDSGMTDDSGTSVAGRRRRQPLRRFRAVAVASAVLMLVAAGFVLIGPVRAMLSPARGLGVFERPPTAEELLRADQVAAAAGLDPGEARTLRAIGRLFGHEFWVHRADGDRVCLLSRREFWFDWIDECVPLAEFEEVGLSRSIVGDDIREAARPPRIRPDDVVVVRWGPRSLDVDWEVERDSEIDSGPRRPAS